MADTQEPRPATPRDRSRITWPLIAAVLLIAGMIWIWVGRTPADETVRWLSWEQATEQARLTGRPILLNVTGEDWCPPCGMMRRNVYVREDVGQYLNTHYLPVKVDCPPPRSQQPRPELETRFAVQAWPTLIVLAPDQQEIDRHAGYIAWSRLEPWLETQRNRLPGQPPTAAPDNAPTTSHEAR